MIDTTSQDVLNAILGAEQADWNGYQRAIVLTPELAKLFLEHSKNFRNRHIRALHLSKIVRAIENGEWKINHQGLAFDIDGKLIDGQHRCHAVVKSGKSVPVLCFYNVPHDSFKTVDDMAKRNQADRFYCEGISDPCTVAALVKLLWQYNGGCMFSSREPSKEEYEAFYSRIPKHIEESILQSRKLSSIRLTPPTAAAFCYYLFILRLSATNTPQSLAGKYFDLLAKFGKDKDDISTKIEEAAPFRVAARFREERKAARRPTNMAILTYLIKGWNAFRKYQDIKCLKYTEGEALPRPE